MTFDELGLSPELLQAISAAGYTEPTPIQEQAIPLALAGRDVLGIAQTGTGKTASFTLPMIERLSRGRARARMPRSLILTPTRELAAQVAENFEKYGKNHKFNMALLIGGVSFGDQDRILATGADVLIATPGRLLDHFERGKLLLTGVQVLVIDEADRMLDMGFIPDIERIVKLTPFTRQTLFFSATMPPEIQRLADQFLSNPAKIEVARQATTAATVTQHVVRVPSKEAKAKRAALRASITHAKVRTAMIFCNRKTDVDIVARSLQRHGLAAAPIHGDLPQSVRTATLDRFKSAEINLLVASDVAARGLDITDVSHVFNYDVPRHPEDYVHRIGRTGRAGRLGEAYTLVTPEDTKSLRAIVELIGKPIPDADVPGVAEAAANARDEGPEEDRGGGRRGRRSGARRGSGSSPATEGATPETAEPVASRAQSSTPPSATGDAPERKRRSGRRSSTAKRDERNASADAPAQGSGADAPESQPALAPAREQAQEPKRDQGRDQGRDQARGQSRSETPQSDGQGGSGRGPRRDRGRGGRDRDGRDRDDGDKIDGFGDHMPAFLMRGRVKSQKEPSD